MIVESADLIDPWIYSTLTADGVITDLVGDNVFGAITPDEVNDPYITIANVSIRDIRAVGIGRIQVDAIYLVKAIAATSSKDDVAPIFARIDTLLNAANVTTPNGYLTCYRETVVDYPEVTEGRTFLHLGGTFRVRATAI